MKPLPEKTVIHVPTKELDQQVCKIFDDAGLRWATDNSYLERTMWSRYESETCYNPTVGQYGDIKIYQREGFTILPAEDFIKMNEVDSPAWVFQTDEELIAFVRQWWRHHGGLNPSFLEEKRKPKFSLICEDGVEVTDPEQIVYYLGRMQVLEGVAKTFDTKEPTAPFFSTESAAQLHLKKTILEKNGISKEDCELIFRNEHGK